VDGVFCNNCGHRNPADANFCSSCGAVLSAGSSDATITLHPVDAQGEAGDEELNVTLPDRPSGTGLLVVKRGPNAGTRFDLVTDVTRVGRHPESDIFLDDITVSRRHAEFLKSRGGYAVRDVGSLNGTYVNRERIEEAVLASGDEVQIGKFKLVYLAAADE
jgi:FHA domain/zinc-ribbon domain